jgi:hypothetical protein
VKEAEARARLVVARNGLEWASRFMTEPSGRIAFFKLHPNKSEEHGDPALMKAIRQKAWHKDYVERLVKVGILARADEPSQILYEVSDTKKAQRVVDDFDDYGPKMLLHKLVFPAQVEIATEFDELLEGKKPPPPEPEEEEPTPEPEPEPKEVPQGSPEALALMQHTLQYLEALGEHLSEVEAKVEKVLEYQKPQADAAVEYHQILEALRSIEHHAELIKDGMKSVHGSLSQKFRDAVVSIKSAIALRDVVQRLTSTQQDTEAAVELLVSQLGKEADDAEGS